MSNASYMSILSDGESRYEEKKSVFLGFARPVQTEEAAIEFITSVKKTYPDARHHVYAYALRDGNKFRYTDDSEPAGTAGMPTLDAIRKRELTDCVVVVVRYFGGTLLGTGGLVKAYSTAAREALSAGIPIRYDQYTTLSVQVDYSDHQRLLPLIKPYEQLDCIFDTSVTIHLRLRTETRDDFLDLIKNATAGRAIASILEEKLDFSDFYSE